MADREQLWKGFTIDSLTVKPDRSLVIDDGQESHLEPKVMDVLVCLAASWGDVVSKDRLVEEVWDGRAVGDDVIARSIAVLRKSLKDDARNPRYVENIRSRGYRLIPEPNPLQPVATPSEPSDVPPPPPSPSYYWPLVAGFVAVLIVYFMIPQREPAAMDSAALFPFECSEQDRILCYGFSEELMDRLLQMEGLRVVRSRDAYTGESGAASIADELDVDWIILGSLVVSGEQMHVDVEIRNRRDGFTEWNEAYPGTRPDAVSIRAVLADDVATFLAGDELLELTASTQPTSLEALEAFTRGQYEFSVRSVASLNRAIEAFEQTIALDPGFGPAFLHLAYAYALIPEYDLAASPNELYEKAINAVNNGIQVDANIEGAAQSVYGFIDHKRGMWSSAGRAHEQAIAADPVYPISHQLYSRLLASTGRLEASLVEAERARQIDWQQAVLISRLAMAHFWLDQLDQAEHFFELSNAHAEYQAPVHDLAYSLFLIRRGRYDDAAAQAAAGIEKYGGDASWIPAVFAGLSDPAQAENARGIVAQLAADGVLTPTVEITLWALLGDGDRAMRIARLLETEGEVFPADLMFIPQFEVLRLHPQFPELLDNIGMTEYWDNSGCAWQENGVVCEDDPA